MFLLLAGTVAHRPCSHPFVPWAPAPSQAPARPGTVPGPSLMELAQQCRVSTALRGSVPAAVILCTGRRRWKKRDA